MTIHYDDEFKIQTNAKKIFDSYQWFVRLYMNCKLFIINRYNAIYIFYNLLIFYYNILYILYYLYLTLYLYISIFLWEIIDIYFQLHYDQIFINYYYIYIFLFTFNY